MQGRYEIERRDGLRDVPVWQRVFLRRDYNQAVATAEKWHRDYRDPVRVVESGQVVWESAR